VFGVSEDWFKDRRAFDEYFKQFRTKEEIALDKLWKIHYEGHDCAQGCPYYDPADFVE
jgi:hypothetical protein